MDKSKSKKIKSIILPALFMLLGAVGVQVPDWVVPAVDSVGDVIIEHIE